MTTAITACSTLMVCNLGPMVSTRSLLVVPAVHEEIR